MSSYCDGIAWGFQIALGLVWMWLAWCEGLSMDCLIHEGSMDRTTWGIHESDCIWCWSRHMWLLLPTLRPSSLFPGPLVQRLSLGLHGDSGLYLDWIVLWWCLFGLQLNGFVWIVPGLWSCHGIQPRLQNWIELKLNLGIGTWLAWSPVLQQLAWVPPTLMQFGKLP